MKSQRPVVIANRIRLLRSQHRGTFLVVEGRDDRLTCEKFAASNDCKIIVAENKQNVCEVVEILECCRFPGILGLVDADFDRIEGRLHRSPNIISPEGHDLESMLVKSAAFDALMIEFGSSEKLARLGTDVRHIVLRAAYKIGCLRLLSYRAGLALRFHGLRYGRVIDQNTLDVDESRLAAAVFHLSQRPTEFLSNVVSQLRQLLREECDPWEVCTGEDLLGVMSVGFRKILGTNNAGDVSIDRLRLYLRLAFGVRDIEDSHLWRHVTEWERRNEGFRVFGKSSAPT